MRDVLFTLGRIASYLPVVLTIIELLVIALLELLVRPHSIHSVLVALIALLAALVLGISLRYFAKIWAMCIAGVVSIAWLYLAVSTVFDVQHNPQKWQNGDGAEGVILLLPVSVVGIIGTTAILAASCRKATK